MYDATPLGITVVIPTTARSIPQLDRAVRSAAAQVYLPVEILVVDDRRDAADDLQGRWTDVPVPVRVVRNLNGRGPSGARNFGAQQSSGDWVALLDDDDWWHPDKLRRQVDRLRAQEPPLDRYIVATRGELVQDAGSVRTGAVLPDRSPCLAEYLFVPARVASADRMILTPSLLCSRRILLDEPFDEGLANWEDIEWLLRVADRGQRLITCPELLTFCDQRRNGVPSQSDSGDADVELRWARTYLAGRSPLAYRNFVLTHGVRRLVRGGQRARAMRIVARTITAGRVSPISAWEGILLAASPGSLLTAVRYLRAALRRVPARTSAGDEDAARCPGR